MIKIAAMFWIAAVVVAALGLFQVKYEVQRLEDDLRLEHRAILDHQEAIHVLKAEWSYLNRPARLADLATRHLGLQLMSIEQVVSIEDLPRRLEAQPETLIPGGATLTTLGGTP